MAIRLVAEKIYGSDQPATLHINDADNSLLVNGTPMSGGGALRQVVFNLSANSMLNGDGTAPFRVTLVPAPGDGYLIYPVLLLFLNLPGTIHYGNGGGVTVTWEDNGIADNPDLTNVFGGDVPILTQGDNLKFTNAQEVSQGNNKALCADIVGSQAGDIITSHVNPTNRGTGYAPGDIGLLGETNQTYTVLTVNGGGGVLTYSLSAPDDTTTIYLVDKSVNTSVSTGGGDGGFQIITDTVTQGNGTGKIICTYLVVPTA